MSEYRWYEIHTKLVNGLKKLYDDFDNEMYPNYKYVGEVLFSKCMEREIEFRKLFNWSKNISEESLDPFHIFVSFNNNNITLDKKIERMQFYFDVLEIPYKLKSDEEDTRYQIPHIPVMQLLTNRQKEKQDEIWHAFINVIINDNIEEIFKYENWYGIAFTVVTEFLFWIDSSKYISLDKNTSRILLESNVIEKKYNNLQVYNNLISEREDFSSNIFRLVVKYAYDWKKPTNPEDHVNLFDFLDNTENRRLIVPKIEEIRNFNKDIEYNRRKINNQFVGLRIKESNKFDVKNLKASTYYRFSNIFDFKNNKDDEIYYNKDLDIDIYSFFNEMGIKDFSFNVNAIVGKNGTGKSTLIELFFIALNNLFSRHDKNTYLKEVDDLEIELFIFNDSLFKIDIGEEIKIYKYQNIDIDNDNLIFSIKKETTFDKFYENNEFFSCIFNYSLHSFNNYDKESWLSKVFYDDNFHKRKIQIEPKRTFGNIEIKNELEKLKQKLSFFLLNNDIVKNKQVSKKQTIEEMSLNLENHKFTEPIDFNEDIDEVNFLRDFLKNNFNVDYETLAFENVKIKKTIYPHEIEDDFSVNLILFLYIKELSQKFHNLEDIIKDKSPLAYEIRRAIYNLKYSTELGLTRKTKKLKIKEFSTILNNIRIAEKKANRDIELMEIIPCSKFYIDFLFEEGNSFSTLSSGEKQKIFITTSIAYYLKNLDQLGYKNAIIFLDEIELYFHPQMQKDFLYDLHEIVLDLVNNEYEGFKVLKSVSFTFITHSPFILSDILNTNLLKLNVNEGRTHVDSNKTKTFASNIYDLLKDDFFIEGGFIGKYADRCIKDIINLIRLYESKDDDLTEFINSYNRFLNKNVEKLNKEDFNEIRLNIKNSSERMKKIVSYVGESILRKKLLDDLDHLFPKDDVDLKFNELRKKNIENIEKDLIDLDDETKILLIKKLLR